MSPNVSYDSVAYSGPRRGGIDLRNWLGLTGVGRVIQVKGVGLTEGDVGGSFSALGHCF